MYKDILQSIDNVAIWPIISFSIFFIFFVCLLWWVFTADKTYIKKMKSLPFDDDDSKAGQGPWKSVAVMFFLLLPAVESMAQGTAEKSFWDDPFNDPMTPLYTVIGLVFVTMILVAVVALYMLRILNLFIRDAEKAAAARKGVPYVPGVSWLEKTWDQLNAAVPVAQEKDIDLGHEYDGIRELDNHLPPWWKGILYGSVVWAIVYMVVYHFAGSLPLSIGEYENDVALAAEQMRIYRAAQPVTLIDENTLAFSADEALIANGKKVFMSNNCGSCHRNDGGGNAIGPNLTDAYWIHGGEIKNIFGTIKTGVVEKGMPAWGKVMSPTDVRDVTFYVMSLQGSEPKGAKAAQGLLFTPKAALSPDTTQVRKNP